MLGEGVRGIKDDRREMLKKREQEKEKREREIEIKRRLSNYTKAYTRTTLELR